MPVNLVSILDGVGAVIDGEDSYEGIRYHVTVNQTGRRVIGTGRIHMANMADVMHVFGSAPVLELANGEAVNIAVLDGDLPRTRLEIRISGTRRGLETRPQGTPSNQRMRTQKNSPIKEFDRSGGAYDR